MNSRVHIIFTGGTIAMRTNAQGQLLPANTGEELLAAIPELAAFAVSTQQLCNVPSAHLTNDHWLLMRQAVISACADENVVGVVLVQGTDTLEETAFFLDASLSNEALHDKPVIITGAMCSADEVDTDGPSNLANAVFVTQSPESKQRGVMVCMQGVIHAARFVRKIHTTRTDAFSSLEHPVLGEMVQASDVQQSSQKPPQNFQQYAINYHASTQRFVPIVSLPEASLGSYNTLVEFPRVDIVSAHYHSDNLFVYASIKNGASAIIIQALGAGNVNPTMREGIERALAQGIPVVISSRVPMGETQALYGYVGGGQNLSQLGAVMAHDLPAHKARIYAQLLLAQEGATSHPKEIIQQGFESIRALA